MCFVHGLKIIAKGDTTIFNFPFSIFNFNNCEVNTMEPVYSQNFTITDLYVDCCGRLLPSRILYMMQEVAGNHFTNLAMDYDSLAR